MLFRSLLIAPEGEVVDLMRAANTSPGAAVDVSHRSTGITISGPFAITALNAFVALDLAPTAFPVDMCTRTLLGKAEIIMWRSSVETFRIDVWRSFAPYVWQCLLEARREFLDAIWE